MTLDGSMAMFITEYVGSDIQPTKINGAMFLLVSTQVTMPLEPLQLTRLWLSLGCLDK